MPTLLKIDSSPRGDQSISRQLGEQFAREWQQSHTGGSIVTRDLAQTDLPFVDTQWIAGAYTPPDQHTAEHKAALKVSDDLIGELESADHILITAPMYNFAIPAVLKAWIDHIVRIGKTFSNTNGAYAGLLKNKKATVILSSGGAYAGTPAEGYDQETPYLRNILGFIGITDVTFVRAGGTSQLMQGKVSAGEFLAPFQSEVRSAASAS